MHAASGYNHFLVPVQWCQFIVNVRMPRRVGAASAKLRNINDNLIVTDTQSLDSVEHRFLGYRYFIDREMDAVPKPLNAAFSGTVPVTAFVKVQRPPGQEIGAEQARRRRARCQPDRMQIRTVSCVTVPAQTSGFFLPGLPGFEQPVQSLRV